MKEELAQREALPTVERAPAVRERGAGMAPRVLDLQHRAGNRAVARLVLARKEKLLSWGVSGMEVRLLQSRLNQVDEVATALLPDGVFGPLTDKAVREFQAAHKLKVDGIAGPKTNAALATALEEDQDSKKLGLKFFELGSESYTRERYGHADEYFQKAIEHAGEQPELIFDRAQALRKLGGRRSEAIALYEAYLATGQTERAAEASKHLAALKAVKTGDAKADQAEALKSFESGAGLYTEGSYGQAYDHFSRAHELAPDSAEMLFNRAQALRRMGGRREETIALYEGYLATGHTERAEEAKKHLAELRVVKTGDEKADKATALKGFEKGAGHYGEGEYSHAYDEFSKAHELAPQETTLMFNRAQALRRMGGRSKEAIALYKAYLATGETDRREESQRWIDILETQGAAF